MYCKRLSTVLWQKSLMLLLLVPVGVRVARAFLLLFCSTFVFSYFFCVNQVFLWISHNNMLLTTHFWNCLLFLTFWSLHDSCSGHDCILNVLILTLHDCCSWHDCILNVLILIITRLLFRTRLYSKRSDSDHYTIVVQDTIVF